MISYNLNTHIDPFPVKNTVILDTETTGVGLDDEIIELGLIDGETGEVLIQTLLRPLKAIPAGATEIHGITNEDVANAPLWAQIQPQFIEAVAGKLVVAYNSSFDKRLVLQTAALHQTPMDIVNWYREEMVTECAMLWYANFWNEWNDRKDCFRWQKLTTAAQQQDLDISDLQAHRATSDCEITRRLIMAVNPQLK